MKTAFSHVTIKLLAALLLLGLSAASIAGNVALNKPATQTSTVNGGTANLAVDNNADTIAKTSSQLGQYWEVNLGRGYRNGTVVIFGQVQYVYGQYRTYYGTSTVQLLLGTTVVQTTNVAAYSARSPSTVRQSLVINTGDVVFDRVRLNNAVGMGLTLASVTVDASPYDSGPNVALGKPTFQTSTYGGRIAPASLAVDGLDDPNWNFGPIHMSRTEHGPSEYWQVDLLFPYKISTISIVNRNDCCADQIVGATVQVMNGAYVVYSHVIDQNDFAATPFLQFSVPSGTVGDRVRVLNKPNEYLTLAEVKVNGVYDYPFPVNGAPGAIMTFKSGVQPPTPATAYAMIKSVNDAVNVSPPVTGYGAATITNSASVQNQTLVPNGAYQHIAEVSTFAFGLAQPTTIKFRAGLDTGIASSLVIDGTPVTFQTYGQSWDLDWNRLSDIGWTEFVNLPAGNHTFQVYGIENGNSSPQSFQYQISGGQWTNFSANDPVLAIRPFGDVLFTPNDQTYYSLSTFTLPPKASGGYETLMFRVRARNDAMIKLGCSSNTNTFYEIALGSYADQNSLMRPINNDNTAIGNDGARLQTNNILSGDEGRDFWVGFDSSANTIRVGRGTDPTQGEFMSWANPPSFAWTGSNRAPLCFQFRTGWGATGDWSGIRNTKTAIQHAVADYPSFVSLFPPPPGAGALFDPNWVNQQWADSNEDPDALRQKIREQAKEEMKKQETFPESTTTLGDVLDALNYLSSSNITQLFSPDLLTYLKALALPNSLDNNLLTGAINRTIIVNNTPLPIYAPGTLNQGLDSYTSATAQSTINSNGRIDGVTPANEPVNATIGSFQNNNEFFVAAQSNVAVSYTHLTLPTIYSV